MLGIGNNGIKGIKKETEETKEILRTSYTQPQVERVQTRYEVPGGDLRWAYSQLLGMDRGVQSSD